ncbi:MAG: hypothetical protein EON61_10880 [Alphaproteobacteria bacterium]|jgi:O-antigen/teichoic acid export membrane protein|nr:MAG: hypothetical protein EON61_10880 [Alphaproteobacteria bacterium]
MTVPSNSGPPEPGHVGRAIRSAMIWNFATMAFGQIAIAYVFLLLAGRLDPMTFGIFALAAVLTDLFYTLGSSSSVDGVVQREDYSRRTLSTVTWTALGICIVVAILFTASSGLYANAIGAPQVAPILEALSLTTLALPFVIGPMAMMRQRLDFKGLAILGMISSLVGSFAALVAAYGPMIEWALVIQRVVTTITMIALATARTRVVPHFTFDTTVARTWLSATYRIFAGQGLAASIPRVIDLFVGMFFGVAAVGYLRVATKLNELAISLLVNPLGQLWVVLLTRARESKQAISGIFLQLTSLVAIVALPGLIGLALVSTELVTLMLNPEYAPVAPMLMALGVLGLFVPLTNSRNAIFTATQQFNNLLKFSALDIVATIAGMLALSAFGSTAMLLGSGLSPILMIIFAVPLILSATHTPWRKLVESLLPPYVAVATMVMGVLALEPLIVDLAPLDSLLAKAAVGATIYVGMLVAFFRRSVFASFKLVAAH